MNNKRIQLMHGDCLEKMKKIKDDSGVGCVLINRKFIGIEKDLKYFEIAKQRINNLKIIN